MIVCFRNGYRSAGREQLSATPEDFERELEKFSSPGDQALSNPEMLVSEVVAKVLFVLPGFITEGAFGTVDEVKSFFNERSPLQRQGGRDRPQVS